MPIIHGTPGADSLDGTPGHDTIHLFGGDDTSAGLAGADTLYGGAGNDVLLASPDPFDEIPSGNDSYYGGAGDDLVVDFTGHDTLFGGAGADVLLTALYEDGFGSGTDRIYGGAGNDVMEGFGVLFGGAGDDDMQGQGWLFGGAGNDFVQKLGFDSVIRGGSGDDILLAIHGSDSVEGGDGVDTLAYSSFYGSFVSYVIDLAAGTAISTDGVDRFTGIENAIGFTEADTLIGGDGANTLSGDEGDDTLTGGAGNDALLGDFGDDLLLHDAGDDLLDGGQFGFDTADYSAAASGIQMYGYSAQGPGWVDRVELVDDSGAVETDTLIDIERVVGTAFADVLSVYAYGAQPVAVRHELHGGGGDDAVFGGELGDALFGGDGDDRLAFFAGGDDTGSGGDGADLFIVDYPFASSDQDYRLLSVTIDDFVRGEDRLSVRGYGESEPWTAATIFALLDTDGSGSLDNGDAAVTVGPTLIDGVKREALSFGIADLGGSVTVRLVGVATLTQADFADYYG